MIDMYALFVIFLSLPIIHSSTTNLPSRELRLKHGGQVLKSLERLLNFFESDVNNLNVDGLYGLRIAQGQLESLNQIFNSAVNQTVRITDKNHYIESLYIQIERIANRSSNQLKIKSPEYLKRFQLLTNKPFRIDYDIRQINPKYYETDSRTAEFDEEESDECFAQLLGSNDRLNTTQCSITSSCWSLVTSTLTKDYRLTHQLLWFLTAKMLGCIDHRNLSKIANQNLKYLEERFCTNIYYDAQTNFELNDNQDLFLEQILLCSIIGYEQFLRLDWLQTILSWQHMNYGCFSDDSNLISKRHLLVEQQMLNGCLSHKSGLASGVLAVYARDYLQYSTK